MGMCQMLLVGLLVAATPTAPDAQPTYIHGILRCPDGSVGKMFVANLRPSQLDLVNACSMRATQRQLRSTPTFRNAKPATSRDELNREAAKLIGKPN